MDPTVSINMPLYNGAQYVAEAIRSVLDQTFADFEIVCVDDGSIDGTGDIVKGFDDPRIVYVFQENRGIGAARNRAFELSRGHHIALLDQDDSWLPEKLERQVAYMKSRSEVGLVYSDCRVVDGEGRFIKLLSRQVPPLEGSVFAELVQSYPIMVSATMIPRQVLGEVGSFREYRHCEDFDLFLRIAARYPIGYIAEPLTRYRIHDAASSHQSRETQLSETLDILDQWAGHELGRRPEVRRAVRNTRAMIYGFTGRQVIYLSQDRRRARQLLRESLRYRFGVRPVLFIGLSWLPSPIVQWARARAKRLLRYY